MILNYNKIVIFGFPRSGTKLLANILESFGYKNYGEWFDTWTSTITGNKCHRKPPHEQVNLYKIWENNKPYAHNLHVTELVERLASWNPNCSKWTVTIWQENLSSLPLIMQKFQHCLWICPKRKEWDQLLSRLIVFYNKNPDGDFPSKKIQINKNIFEIFYWKLQHVNIMQNTLTQLYNTVNIDFDELLSGKCEKFGEKYSICTTDQHTQLEQFVENIQDVKIWYALLQEETSRPKTNLML